MPVPALASTYALTCEVGSCGYGYPLEVGSTVQVVRIDGATAVVAPLTPRAGITGAVPPDGPGEAQ